MIKKKIPHTGSSLTGFLKEEGIYEEVLAEVKEMEAEAKNKRQAKIKRDNPSRAITSKGSVRRKRNSYTPGLVPLMAATRSTRVKKDNSNKRRVVYKKAPSR